MSTRYDFDELVDLDRRDCLAAAREHETFQDFADWLKEEFRPPAPSDECSMRVHNQYERRLLEWDCFDWDFHALELWTEAGRETDDD